MQSELLDKLALAIIKSQEEIIGPMAWSQAVNISGMVVDQASNTAHASDSQAVDGLVKSYHDFFGEAAVEVCKSAVRGLAATISAEDMPKSLR
jgi:hypothetical protein